MEGNFDWTKTGKSKKSEHKVINETLDETAMRVYEALLPCYMGPEVCEKIARWHRREVLKAIRIEAAYVRAKG